MVDPWIGRTIDGYRLEEQIGRGGMGTVYRARDLGIIGRQVAVKLILSGLAEDPAFRERFEREARIAGSIDHPNVVPVYAAGQTEDRVLYIAMRFVAGHSLAELIAAEGPLEPRRATALIAQTGDALTAAHAAGLIHRDVKPGNVLVSAAHGTEHCYLTDFGLTRAASGTAITPESHVVGTPDYMPPEQIEGRELGPATDTYALGCVLFQVLTGRLPFERDSDMAKLYAHMNDDPPSPHELTPNVPEALDAVVHRALAKDPAKRQPSPSALGREAVEAAGGKAAPATAGPGRTRPSPRMPLAKLRGRLAVAITAAAAAAAAAAMIAVALSGGTDQPEVGDPIVVGAGPAAVAAADGAVWVASLPNTAVPIDPETRVAGSPVAVGTRPNGIEIANGRVWVANTGDADDPDSQSVARLDLEGEPIGTPTRVTGEPIDVKVVGGTAWVLSSATGTVHRLDARTARRAGPPVVTGLGAASGEEDDGGASAAITAGLGAIWVANTAQGLVTRIDPESGETRTINVGSNPLAIAVAGGALFVVTGGEVRRVDSETGEVTAAIDIEEPFALASDSDTVWATGLADKNVVVQIDAATGEAIGSPLEVGGQPQAITAGEGVVWVANFEDGTVTPIDP